MLGWCFHLYLSLNKGSFKEIAQNAGVYRSRDRSMTQVHLLGRGWIQQHSQSQEQNVLHCSRRTPPESNQTACGFPLEHMRERQPGSF